MDALGDTDSNATDDLARGAVFSRYQQVLTRAAGVAHQTRLRATLGEEDYGVY